jgi:hypothetical protein
MKIIWLGLIVAVTVGVALLPAPTDFFVGVPTADASAIGGQH